MSKILISYRREDSPHVTGRIYDRLTQQFGRTAVFKDVDSIPLGIDFRIYLDQQVAKCDVFLAVIGRNWMKPQGQKGRSRLADPADFVRLEIEAALKRQIPVIPVLVEGASIPPVDRLPTSLQGLSYRNGIIVRPDPDFHRDMDRLIEYLKGQLQRDQEHLPPEAGQHIGGVVNDTIGVAHLKFTTPGQESATSRRSVSGTGFSQDLQPIQVDVPTDFTGSQCIPSGGIPPDEQGYPKFEGLGQVSTEPAVRKSELDSQQRREVQSKEEGAASTPRSRTTTDWSRSYILGGFGLIALIGIVVAFMSFQQIGQKETTPESETLSSMSTSTSSKHSANVTTRMSLQNLVPESPKTEVPSPDRIRYEHLLSLFREGDLSGSTQGFSEFLDEFPNSDLAPNARFWLAESYFGRKDFQKAIANYEKVETDYPGSEKIIPAILKRGYAYLGMKDKKRAVYFFNQVVTLYPKSVEAGKAQDKLAQLREVP
jgi:tol-pal system protein YbgF